VGALCRGHTIFSAARFASRSCARGNAKFVTASPPFLPSLRTLLGPGVRRRLHVRGRVRTLAFERFAIPPSPAVCPSPLHRLLHPPVRPAPFLFFCPRTSGLFIFLPTNLNDLSGDENQQLRDGEADAAAARAGLLADAPPNIAGQ
jgi:hypothetical protein